MGERMTLIGLAMTRTATRRTLFRGRIARFDA
jgi:hypothetical protein